MERTSRTGPTDSQQYTPGRCTVVAPAAGSAFRGLCAENAGATGLSLQACSVGHAGDPEAGAHLHERHDTALYVLSGALAARFGDWLQDTVVARAGEFLLVPAGVPHAPEPVRRGEPCAVVVARSDSSEAVESVALPELDAARDADVDAARGAVGPSRAAA